MRNDRGLLECPGEGFHRQGRSISPTSGCCVCHRDPPSKSLRLGGVVKSRTEEHRSLLGQEPAWNHKSSFMEQSIQLEMNMAKVTGCEPPC